MAQATLNRWHRLTAGIVLTAAIVLAACSEAPIPIPSPVISPSLYRYRPNPAGSGVGLLAMEYLGRSINSNLKRNGSNLMRVDSSFGHDDSAQHLTESLQVREGP